MFYICFRGLVEKVCYAQDEEDILMQRQDTVPLFFPWVIEDLLFWVHFDNFHIYHQELFSNTTFVYVYTVRRDKTELELMAHIKGLNSINEKYAGIARLLWINSA